MKQVQEMAQEPDAIKYGDLDPAEFSVLLIGVFPNGRVNGRGRHKEIVLYLRALGDVSLLDAP
jgi:hypothetical protein